MKWRRILAVVEGAGAGLFVLGMVGYYTTLGRLPAPTGKLAKETIELRMLLWDVFAVIMNGSVILTAIGMLLFWGWWDIIPLLGGCLRRRVNLPRKLLS